MNDLAVTDYTVTTAAADTVGIAVPMTESESYTELLGRYAALDSVHEEMTVDNFNVTRDLILNHVLACDDLIGADASEKRAYAEAYCDEQEMAYCLSLPESQQHWTKGNAKTPRRLLVAKHLTGPYKSAKSVILCAIGENVSLYDAEGEALGKTALQNALKDAKSPQEKIVTTVETLKKLLAQCDDREAQAAWILNQIGEVWKDAVAVREAKEAAVANS
jgi:hypothetical protein